IYAARPCVCDPCREIVGFVYDEQRLLWQVARNIFKETRVPWAKEVVVIGYPDFGKGQERFGDFVWAHACRSAESAQVVHLYRAVSEEIWRHDPAEAPFLFDSLTTAASLVAGMGTGRDGEIGLFPHLKVAEEAVLSR